MAYDHLLDVAVPINASSMTENRQYQMHNPYLSLQFSKIAGGISNFLVKVAPHSSTGLQPVAVKVFGEKTELLIDREAEKQAVLDLGALGFGPKV